MDFDAEMSSLQIEDLGEYFFPNELTNDNWKGFSLGYGEEDSTLTSTNSTSTSMAASSVSKPIAIARSTSQSRDRSGSLSNSLSSGIGGGGGLSLGALMQDPTLLVSPPSMLGPSFSEMLKHTNGALSAAAMGLDFPMSPASTPFSTMTTTATTTATTSTSGPRSKDEQLMDLANFTLEGRFQRVAAKPTAPPPALLLPQRPDAPAIAKQLAPTVAPNTGNRAAVCKRIMDEDDDDNDNDDDDDDDDETYSTKRRASGKSTPFGSKRSFDMVESCVNARCATIAAPEDDRGFRKKSREKMRRQEVNVKFDELIDLLGLSNRVRKSAILHEAVSAIKSLQRERDEMRRDRDRLQQEVSKLATCLQYSHLGSVAAANAAAAMSQVQVTQNHHFQQAPLAMNAHQMPGPACFPIGGTAFSATLAAAGGGAGAAGISTSSAVHATPIAPKVLKSASDLKT